MIAIRTLQTDELHIWIKLRLDALADAPEAFGDAIDQARQRTEKEWRDSLLEGDGKLFIAQDDGFPIGMARVRRSLTDPRSSGLYSMWVAPSARARGVGKTLMDAALAWAAEAGVDEMELFVTRGNQRAKRLYLASGFVETGVLKPLRSSPDIQMEGMVRRISHKALGE